MKLLNKSIKLIDQNGVFSLFFYYRTLSFTIVRRFFSRWYLRFTSITLTNRSINWRVFAFVCETKHTCEENNRRIGGKHWHRIQFTWNRLYRNSIKVALVQVVKSRLHLNTFFSLNRFDEKIHWRLHKIERLVCCSRNCYLHPKKALDVYSLQN